MMSGPDLLSSIREKESRVRDLQRRDRDSSDTGRSNEREVLDLLNRLRKAYRTLLVQHVDELYDSGPDGPAVCDSITPPRDSRDIAGHVWRSCFYKQISEFRGALKRHTAALSAAAGRPLPVAGSDPSALQREQVHIARLTQGLLEFLSDSMNYFQRIVHELEGRARAAAGQGVQWLRRCCVRTVFRCLLYLGDLSRYREMYSERTQKDFSEAMRYYERAALLEPASGNAQNQLAVLATYSEADCVAAFHHCRSILSVEPFSGGFENLSALLAKNAAAARALGERPSPLIKRPGAALAQLPAFLTRFLHVHGVLFGWSTRMHQSYAQLLSSQQSSGHTPSSASGSQRSHQQHWASALSPAVASALDLAGGGSSKSGELEARFAAMLQATLEELDEQLSAGSIPDVLLVRLLAISVFSVHYAAAREANLLGWQDAVCTREGLEIYNAMHGEHSRSNAEALALTALFGLVNRTATRLATTMTSSDRAARSLLHRCLPMLSVFATWAASHPALLDPRRPSGPRSGGSAALSRRDAGAGEAQARHDVEADDPVAPPAMFADGPDSAGAGADHVSSQCWEETHLASATAERAEARARSALKAALTGLAPVLEAEVQRAQQKELKKKNDAPVAKGGGGLLREHLELRGFLPVAALIEEGFVGFDPLSSEPQLLSDSAAGVYRVRAVLGVVTSIRASKPSSKAPATAPLSTSAYPPQGDQLAGAGKAERQRVGSNTNTKTKQRGPPARSASPDQARPTPPAAPRGPPAVPSSVAKLCDLSPLPPDQALPLNPLDFPALPSRVPSAPPNGDGTGTQDETSETEVGYSTGNAERGEEYDDVEEGLDDVVVFKSAFVRAPCSSLRNSGTEDHTDPSGVAAGGPVNAMAATRVDASVTGSDLGWSVPATDELWDASTGTRTSAGPQQIASATDGLRSTGSFFADLGLPPLDNPPLPAPSFGSPLFPGQTLVADGALGSHEGITGGHGHLGDGLWDLGTGLGGWDVYQRQPLPQLGEPALDISFLLDCDTPLGARESAGAPSNSSAGQHSQLPRWLTEGGTAFSSAIAASAPAPAAASIFTSPPGLNRTAFGSGHSSSASSFADLQQDLSYQGTVPAPPIRPARPPGLG